MFESLSEKLNAVFDNLKRRGKLTEADVDLAMREVKLALLEADVNYAVVRSFTNRVKERAVGAEVSKALNPAQMVIKIVNEELISTLGKPVELNLKGERPHVLMLVGLQGSGKTTAAAKIAKKLRSSGERVMLVAADIYRPAAIKQLQTLGERIDVPVFTLPGAKPVQIAKEAWQSARNGGYSVMIIDTAGRSQLDNELMDELVGINKAVPAKEILLVVDSMIGQEALNIAKGFQKEIPITGLVFTKIDGDARGGAAISIREVTGIPIKFLGTGEALDALEVFDPIRISNRILGMGDMLGLIERAEAAYTGDIDSKEAERMLSGQFTLDDFAKQLRQMKKMGPISQLFGMLPGQLNAVAKTVDPHEAESQLKTVEAIIDSMTPAERRDPKLLNASRRRRIAAGSGKEVQDVNRLMKQFRDIQKLMKSFQKTGGRGNIGRLLR
ncbi:MAG: signal recognition particle protein [Anaerolineaceae bacterium]|jgi:signal recognition particle subunit SRP54|nr:signal recognition particle protein [Anaerolineaceae bacterium]MDD4042134.1 signal recognition particle protein [Anaerolineaceae bacterium]